MQFAKLLTSNLVAIPQGVNTLPCSNSQSC